MQKNYIVLAHKNPLQLKKLIDKLDDGMSHFYIHIDSNIDDAPFKNTLKNNDVNFIENREAGTWGDLGIVKATINAMRAVLKNNNNPEYCILISGQDYPIKSLEKINAFLDKNAGQDFIDIEPVQDAWPVEWVKRVDYYKYNWSLKRGDYVLIPTIYSKSFFRLETLKSILKPLVYARNIKIYKTIFKNLLQKRKEIGEIKAYGGSQWWTLTNLTVSKILNCIDSNNEFIKYHEYTLLPDEIFFQSILVYLSQNDSTIKINPSITYVNWERPNCELPVTFVSSDLNELKSLPENKLFARKFDLEIDEEIFEKINANLNLF